MNRELRALSANEINDVTGGLAMTPFMIMATLGIGVGILASGTAGGFIGVAIERSRRRRRRR